MNKLTLILLFIISPNLYSAKLSSIDWKLKTEKDEIKVFNPVSYKHPSGLVPLRFKAVLNYNISKVLSVLDDGERKQEWMPSIRKIIELEKPNKKEKISYYRYKAPWPLSERDFIVHNIGDFDLKSKTVTVNIKSVEHPKDPSPTDTVRGISYDGYSKIRYINETTTEVEMAFLNDFKGSIPTFLINYVQSKWPYKFMKNLKIQLLKKDIIINPDYVFENK
jgi:hypothetical protein